MNLAWGSTAVQVESDDRAAEDWLVEFVAPWFSAVATAPDMRLDLSSSPGEYARLAESGPSDPAARPCFALDQQVVSLPTWIADGSLVVADSRRDCAFAVTPSRIRLFGEPSSRRWRFTSYLVLQQIAAARARRSALDLHASAIESGGRGIAIVGRKRAGKTTLSLHLLRSGRCRWIANDRTFAEPAAAGFTVRGMPTAVRIAPELLRDFPELGHGLRNVERPYLYGVEEVRSDGDPLDPSVEFALSPPQLARQLGAERVTAAPLAAVVFPKIDANAVGFVVERVDGAAARALLAENQYGGASFPRAQTLFEDLDGGEPASPDDLAAEVADAVPAFRVRLGPDAYASPDFAARILASILC